MWSVNWDKLFQHHLLKRLSFPQRTTLAPLSKINWLHICECISFWILYIAPLIYMSILSSVPHYQSYCLVLKSGSVNILTLLFFFKILLVILFLLPFHINFMNQAVGFCKKSCRDFKWNCVNLRSVWGKLTS